MGNKQSKKNVTTSSDKKVEYEDRLKIAEKLFIKWIKKAPLWSSDVNGEICDYITNNTIHVTGNIMYTKEEMEKPWLVNIKDFSEGCARSIAIGGGFPSGGNFKFSHNISSDIYSLKIPYIDALEKNNTNGDFYHWYYGSVFRNDKDATSIIITWRSGRSGSWGQI